ncbi:nucleotidyltransferase [Neiella marina]|uniref:Nucleotidyltransferase n=1 Tax=Neiella marina TaxID=508461 RepID=A0A8J2XPI1_9GAMM|nr:DNA polymerase Y family protein [Neiella marina]GGA88133.1 nucleotidyltransferase [Neiella marina]
MASPNLPVWLYLHFPHLQADQLSLQNPQAPIAILDQSKRVWQHCRLAQASGIQTGMVFTTALQLAPELQLQPQRSNEQQQILAQMADYCYQWCARIALSFEQGLLLEVATMWRLFGGRANYWQQLQQALQSRQLRFHAAAGTTPMAAYVLARAGYDLPLASTQQLNQQLQQLTLQQLPLSASQQQSLTDVGIKQLADLTNIPMAQWRRRFSGEIATWLERLNGDKVDDHCWFEPPAQFVRNWHCLHEINHSNGLLFPLQHMLKELSHYLRRRQLAACAVELILQHREQTDSQISLRLAQPEHQASEFLLLARLRLQQLPLPEPVIGIQVVAAELVSQQQPATDLFAATNSHALDGGQLLNRLRSRLAPSDVKHLALAADPRPERAFQLVTESDTPITAGTQNGGRGDVQDNGRDHIQDSANRPVWLLPKPVPLPNQPWELKSAPERIACGWWDDGAIQRDYFVAVDQHGQLCWVFRTPANQWFLHGWFG